MNIIQSIVFSRAVQIIVMILVLGFMAIVAGQNKVDPVLSLIIAAICLFGIFRRLL